MLTCLVPTGSPPRSFSALDDGRRTETVSPPDRAEEIPRQGAGRLVSSLTMAVALLNAATAVASSTPSFAAAMSRICIAGTERANAIGQVNGLGDLARLGHRLIAVDRWELDRVVELGSPPDPISKYVAQFITTQRRINEIGEAAVSAARRGDDVTAQRLSQRSGALTRTQDLDARMIGATKCSSTSGAR